MATIGALHGRLGLNVSDFNRGLSTSVMGVRSWHRDVRQIVNATRTPWDQYRMRLTRLRMAHAAGQLGTHELASGLGLLRRQYLQSLTTTQLLRTGTAGLGEMLRRTAVAAKGTAASFGLILAPIVLVATAIRGLKGAAGATEEFTQSMRNSLAIIPDVSEDVQRAMGQMAHDVAFETKFSAKECAEAYWHLFSAGMQVEQSMRALPQVARFAQAGNFDLAQATKVLTGAQMAMGMESKNAADNLVSLARVSDVLVKANTLAKGSVEEFSQALANKAGASLRLLGKDLEEGVAVLAAFAQSNLVAEEAGSALHIVLRDLQRAAIKHGDAWKAAGLKVYDAGEMRHVADIIGDLTNKLKDLSDEERKRMLMELGFQERSVARTQMLLGQADAIREWEAALKKAGGTTDDVAAKQLPEFSKGCHQMKVAMTEASAAIFTEPLEHLGTVLQKVAQYAKDGAKGYALLRATVTSFYADITGLPWFREAAHAAQRDLFKVVMPSTALGEGGDAAIGAIGSAANHAAEDVEGLADALDNLGKTVPAIENLEKTLLRLQRDVATFGKSPGDKAIWDFIQAGIPTTQKQIGQMNQIRSMEQLQGSQQFGQTLKSQFQTPLEKFRQQMEQLEQWRAYGLAGKVGFDEGLYGRAVEAYEQTAMGALVKESKGFGPAPGYEKGTAEAYSAIVQARMRGGPQSEERRTVQQQLAEMKKEVAASVRTNDLLETINDRLDFAVVDIGG